MLNPFRVSALVLCLFFINCIGSNGGGGSNGNSDNDGSSNSGTTPSGNELVDLVNEYRVEQGLGAIPYSSSLTTVAEAHVNDLQNNGPNAGDCNMHSWSAEGDWTACCYTPDNAEAQCMWDKPNEITNGVYTGYGYEISATGNAGLTAEEALDQWKNSEPHNDVMINQGAWIDTEFNAIGAAISENYAVVWFGEETDPAE